MVTEEQIKERFECSSDVCHSSLRSQIKNTINSIKDTWNFNNADIAFFLNTTETNIEAILSENWNGRMSSKSLSRLHLIDFGVHKLINVDLSEPEIKILGDIIADYQTTKQPIKTRDEKIQDILDLFGVKDDETLDKLLNTIVQVRKTYDLVDEECKQEKTCACEKKECDCNKNLNKNFGKVNFTVFDSNTMEKPEHVSFDLNAKDSDELLKKVAKTINNISKKF